MNLTYIEVSAEVRYWEDAIVDGAKDTDGTLIPHRSGSLWVPVIRLADGAVMDWPHGTQADIHYKVCDQGEYWLLDEGKKRVLKWRGDYVPDDLLCQGENGYGDYIILKVGPHGKVVGWRRELLDATQWVAVLHNAMVSGCAAIKDQETRNSACAVRLTNQLEAACRDQADDATHKLAAPQQRARPTRSAMPSFTAHPNQASPESQAVRTRNPPANACGP